MVGMHAHFLNNYGHLISLFKKFTTASIRHLLWCPNPRHLKFLGALPVSESLCSKANFPSVFQLKNCIFVKKCHFLSENSCAVLTTPKFEPLYRICYCTSNGLTRTHLDTYTPAHRSSISQVIPMPASPFPFALNYLVQAQQLENF
jgi:hypothetical protein